MTASIVSYRRGGIQNHPCRHGRLVSAGSAHTIRYDHPVRTLAPLYKPECIIICLAGKRAPLFGIHSKVCINTGKIIRIRILLLALLPQAAKRAAMEAAIKMIYINLFTTILRLMLIKNIRKTCLTGSFPRQWPTWQVSVKRGFTVFGAGSLLTLIHSVQSILCQTVTYSTPRKTGPACSS
ncbi:hypothetical protein SAMN02745823_00952 [Sporobacter termitidis DSM 10068]|uniref:Uncharacterized protein n=1 Tax=Sporobacter termitidis DSM 10068 TaxID=1123282 RepID=A0A1M5VPU3_9FIRM|nr:hypothetical protein SAMN02745823_00952 [Sporobacter termitidis DSM 10068]